MKYFHIILLLLMFSCSPKDHEETRLQSMEAALLAKAEPTYFVGTWEHLNEEYKNYQLLHAKFEINDEDNLVLTRTRTNIYTGESVPTSNDHSQTLDWLNSYVNVIDDDHFIYVKHGESLFTRITPKIEKGSHDEQLEQVAEAMKALNTIRFRPLIEVFIEDLQAELNEWKDTDLNAEQVKRLDAIERFIRLYPAYAAALSPFLDDLEGQKSRAKMVAAFKQAVEVFKTGASCTAAYTDLGDLHALMFGTDLCTGEGLSKGDRLVAGMSIFVGSSKVIREAKKTVPSELLDETAEAAEYATNLKLSEKGLRIYGKLHDALKTLPDGLKAKRIIEGTDPKKIAIIGRSMGNRKIKPIQVGVKDAASHLESKGIRIETFSDNDAWGDFVKHQQRYNAGQGLSFRYLPST